MLLLVFAAFLATSLELLHFIIGAFPLISANSVVVMTVRPRRVDCLSLQDRLQVLIQMLVRTRRTSRFRQELVVGRLFDEDALRSFVVDLREEVAWPGRCFGVCRRLLDGYEVELLIFLHAWLLQLGRFLNFEKIVDEANSDLRLVSLERLLHAADKDALLSHLVLLDFFHLLETFLLLASFQEHEALLLGPRVLILVNLGIAEAATRGSFADSLRDPILLLIRFVKALFIKYLVEVVVFELEQVAESEGLEVLFNVLYVVANPREATSIVGSLDGRRAAVHGVDVVFGPQIET